MPAKNNSLDETDIINLYLNGSSIKKLSLDFKVSRQVIYRILREAKISIRGRSESMFIRMGQTSFDERVKLVKKANEVKRGKPANEESLQKSALTKERTLSKLGKEEVIFSEWLNEFGIKGVLQKAFGRYNIDIAVKPVAVEILFNPAEPLSRANDVRKIKYIGENNWSIIYVWISRNHFITKECAQYVASLIKKIKRNPSLRCKYWVVRGSGELYSTNSGNPN